MSDQEDTQPSKQPAEKPTVKMDVVPPWAIALSKSLTDGFVAVETRLDSQDTKLDKVITEGIEANTRLTRVEVRIEEAEKKVGELEGRIGRTSTGVKGLSSADLKHESDMAAKIIEDAERDRKIKETHDLAIENAKTLKDQSDFMGMGKRGAAWLASKEGRTAMAQIGAAIVCAYEFFKHSGVIK